MDKVTIDFIDFIETLCNHDDFQIQLLRHNLKNIVVRKNFGQVAFRAWVNR